MWCASHVVQTQLFCPFYTCTHVSSTPSDVFGGPSSLLWLSMSTWIDYFDHPSSLPVVMSASVWLHGSWFTSCFMLAVRLLYISATVCCLIVQLITLHQHLHTCCLLIAVLPRFCTGVGFRVSPFCKVSCFNHIVYHLLCSPGLPHFPHIAAFAFNHSLMRSLLPR